MIDLLMILVLVQQLNIPDMHEDVRNINLELADLLLARGQRSGEKGDEVELEAERYPRGHPNREAGLARANELKGITKRRLDEAISRYDTVLQRAIIENQNDRERILYNRMHAYYILGNYPKTIELGQGIIDLLASGVEQGDSSSEVRYLVYYLLGDAAWKDRKYDKVKRYYQEALRLENFIPRESGVWSHKAALRMAQTYFVKEKNYDRAIAEFEKILSRYQHSGWRYLTLFWLAQSYQNRADHRAQSSDPVEKAAAQQDYELAVVHYGNALDGRASAEYIDKLHRDYEQVCYFGRGFSAYYSGNLPRARQFLSEAIEEYPNHPECVKARETLGDVYVQLGHLDRAIPMYRHYLLQAYSNPDGQISRKLADALLQRFEYAEARNILEKVLRDHRVELEDPRFPDSPVRHEPGRAVLYRLAESYVEEAEGLFEEQRAERLRDAIRAYQRILDTFGDLEIVPLREMGGLSFQLAEAVPDGERHYRDSTVYLTLYLDQYGQRAEVTDDKLRGHYLYTLGEAYSRLEMYEEAVQRFREVDSRTTVSPEEWGRSFLKMGESYERLLEQAAGNPIDQKRFYDLAVTAYMNTDQAGIPELTQKAGLAMGFLRAKNDALFLDQTAGT